MLKRKGAKEGVKAKKLLLDSSGSDEDDNILEKKGKSGNNSTLTINNDYAQRYDKWRTLEETEKLKARLGVKDVNELDEESSSESSSEEDEDWTGEKEKAFLKTLACLKKKDPKIYENQFGFFKDVQEDDKQKPTEIWKNKKEKAKKPFTVRDHERVMTLEKANRGDDNDDESDSNETTGKQTKSYPEELASIKTAFSKALNEIDSSDDDDGDTLLGSKLLKQRDVKSAEERQQEEEEYKRWLKGELDTVAKGKLSGSDKKELTFLREYWNDDKLDEGEKFLRDYILNKKYIDPSKKDKDEDYPSYNEVVDDDELSNDEKFEAEREEFEHKYNFRFEEPDQEFIKRYPRTIQNSMRREESKRKEQRQKAKDRKEDAKARKKEEVQRLKAFKRKEILDKIQTLHEIAGNSELNLTEVDIEGDFDPEEYDRRMQELFNDDYYQEGVDQEKPQFPFDEEIDDEENWDEWVPGTNKSESEAASKESDNEEEALDQDARSGDKQSKSSASTRKKSTQQELIEASTRKRSRRKRSTFLDVLEREKPKFDPKIHKSFEEYFDEYYKLDFEDLVGDLKCRFKYHKTTPNDFGLSMDEILRAEDRELNQWASLKKTFQYRNADEEEYEAKAYKKKGLQENLKKRVLPSIYQTSESERLVEPQESNENAESSEVTKKKRKKKKKKKGRNQNQESNTTVNQNVQNSEGNPGFVSKKESPETTSLTKPTSHVQENRAASGLSRRQRKNLKRTSTGTPANESHAVDKESTVTHSEPKKSKKDRKAYKMKSQDSKDTSGINIDEDRLRAYGLNPKKLKKQMKYGASARK